jgi:hypothetical protein
MNDRNTLVMIDLITTTHPDRQYLDGSGEPHRCCDCHGLMFWTDTKGWCHHRNNPSCWMNRQEQP